MKWFTNKRIYTDLEKKKNDESVIDKTRLHGNGPHKIFAITKCFEAH